MARTVRDVAALYEVLTGLDHVLERVARGFDGARVAVATNFTTGHPATDQLFRDVIESARNAGTTFSEVVVTEADAAVEADELTVLLSEMSDDLTASCSAEVDRGPRRSRSASSSRTITATSNSRSSGTNSSTRRSPPEAGAVRSIATRDRGTSTWAVDQCLTPALSDVDCFVAPCYSPAWKNDLVLGGSGSARWSQVNQASAIAGWPIATVPMGVIDGLPVGLSIVARPGDETIMLAVAAGFERVVDLARGDALTPTFLRPQTG